MISHFRYCSSASWSIIKSLRCFATKSVREKVKIVEVGPRDGLQNEKIFVDTDLKIELINRLSKAGLKYIEATSFVSPKWIPQMKDNTEVMKRIERVKDCIYSALTPNLKGFDNAVECKVDEVAVFAAASESFSKKNINCSIAESLERFYPLFKKAAQYRLPVRGYVSCVLGCPYEGPIDPLKVYEVTDQLLSQNCHEVSLGDTIGVGTPLETEKLLNLLIQKRIPLEKIAIHCHDTYGQALANIFVALQAGIRTVDSSVAGLGGCPYAKGASGNVSTEDLVYMLHGSQFDTGIHLATIIQIGNWISEKMGRQNQSKLSKTNYLKQVS